MKRCSTTDPLTPDDVAERLDHAALRVLRILMDVRQIEGLCDAVKQSRYLTNTCHDLAAELVVWGFHISGDATAGGLSYDRPGDYPRSQQPGSTDSRPTADA